jgi:Protein of unknown function (DUF2490)
MLEPKTEPIFFTKNIYFKLFFLVLFIIPIVSFSQIEKDYQFSNDFQFNAVIGKKTATEFDLAQGFTSEINTSNPFHKISQISGRIWIHYYLNPKWKLSGFTAYYYNQDVPEITQKKSSEIRIAFQGIYYFIKEKYTLSNRIRVEDRLMGNGNNNIDIVFRFREMIKLVYPISILKLKENALYGIVSEEIFLKTKGSTTGNESFDRNRLTLGFGYSFTDHFQIELSYMNEYLPRDSNDKIYNSISTSLIFNDLISTLRKKNGTIPLH